MEQNQANEGIKDTLKGKTVLIVEDDEFIFNLLEFMLSGTGIVVIYANNGERAIELIENKNVDLVLLDVRLPGKNGFEVFKKIRMMKSHIPVVAQTANSQPEEREKFLAAGFDDYLLKPVDSNTIQELIYRLIGNPN